MYKAFAAVTAMAALLLAGGCDNVFAPPMAESLAEQNDAESAPVAGPRAAPVAAGERPAAAFAADLEWSATAASSVTGTDPAGRTVKFAKDGVLAVVAFNHPISAGDKITIRASATGPAGRVLRIAAARHCEATDDVDITTADFEMTGSPVQIAVTHTFSRAYTCIKLSVNPLDRQAMDVTFSGVQFFKD